MLKTLLFGVEFCAKQIAKGTSWAKAQRIHVSFTSFTSRVKALALPNEMMIIIIIMMMNDGKKIPV